MTKFLTIKEAAQLVGKSPSSIRRIIYPILENDKHPDRPHVEPNVANAKALRIKGENFAWKISEQLLRREIPEPDPKTAAHSKNAGSQPNDGSAVLIEMLRGELEIKNQQIAALNKLTEGLNERLREGNILMGTLQQQFALTDGSARQNADIVQAAPTQEKGSEAHDKTAPPKRKFFGLFR